MNRIVFFSSLLLILAFGCHTETSTEVSIDIPQWLKAKIDSMSVNAQYGGTVVYRYSWHNERVYEIFIPISSCAHCEIYNQNGEKIQFSSDAQIQDYLSNRTDKVIIWSYRI